MLTEHRRAGSEFALQKKIATSIGELIEERIQLYRGGRKILVAPRVSGDGSNFSRGSLWEEGRWRVGCFVKVG